MVSCFLIPRTVLDTFLVKKYGICRRAGTVDNRREVISGGQPETCTSSITVDQHRTAREAYFRDIGTEVKLYDKKET